MVDGPHGNAAFPSPVWRRGRSVDGNGVITHTGNAPLVAAVGGTKTVTVPAHTALVQGVVVDFPDTTLNLAAVGTPPAAGQSRVEFVGWQYTGSSSALSLVVVAGTPATTPTNPSATRDRDGDWFQPISRIVRGPGNVNVTQAMISRYHQWIGPVTVAQSAGDLLTDATLGSIAVVAAEGDLMFRDLAGSPLAPSWVSLFNPPFTALTLAAGFAPADASDGATPGMRLRGGRLEFDGAIKKSSAPWMGTGTTYVLGSVPSSITAAMAPKQVLVALGGGGAAAGRLSLGSDGRLLLDPLSDNNSRVVRLDGVYFNVRG